MLQQSNDPERFKYRYHGLEKHQYCHRGSTALGKVRFCNTCLRPTSIDALNLSSIMAARSTRTLAERRITHIICTRRSCLRRARSFDLKHSNSVLPRPNPWRIAGKVGMTEDCIQRAPRSRSIPDSGITHMRIPVEDVDYADLLIYLPRACAFIEEALQYGGRVLVHCVQGLSRSAAVVAAYRRHLPFVAH